MSIQSQIARLQGCISDVYSAISTKGGTLPAQQNIDNMVSAISTIPSVSNKFEKIFTSAEMDSKLAENYENRGFKYIGTTDAKYTNGNIYHCVEAPPYLQFIAQAATDIAFNIIGKLTTTPTVQYSLDATTWNDYTFDTTISLAAGGKCYWKGDNSSWSEPNNYINFSSTGGIEAHGNIMSILDSTMESVTIPTSYCFQSFFRGCKKLSTAPILPATNLGQYCYQYMFRDCTSLTTAPTLPATTLAAHCYYNMFCSCTSLTTPPALPATTLGNYCYSDMFSGCTSLQVSKTQTEDAPYIWVIPTSGVFTSTQPQPNMFKNCAGTRASDDMTGGEGSSYTYYTQNIPV